MSTDYRLRTTASLLARAGVDSPRVDAEILLSRAWRKDRAWILAHGDAVVPATVARMFSRFISRRARREPLAYILGYKEFYSRKFLVNRHVLVPRPETELLIEQTIKQLSNLATKQLGSVAQSLSSSVTLVDVGTGSGCIAVTLAKLFPQARVFATDLSRQALAVARANAREQKARVKFLKGDLLEPYLSLRGSRATEAISQSLGDRHARRGLARDDKMIIIIANLPYIPTRDLKGLAPEIRDCEPRGALDGGRDGLREYRRLLRQLKRIAHSPHPRPLSPRERVRVRAPLPQAGEREMVIVCELNPSQAPAFRAMAKKILPAARLSLVPSPVKARCAILSGESERRR